MYDLVPSLLSFFNLTSHAHSHTLVAFDLRYSSSLMYDLVPSLRFSRQYNKPRTLTYSCCIFDLSYSSSLMYDLRPSLLSSPHSYKPRTLTYSCCAFNLSYSSILMYDLVPSLLFFFNLASTHTHILLLRLFLGTPAASCTI